MGGTLLLLPVRRPGTVGGIRHGVTGSYLGVRLRRRDRSEKGERRWTGFRDLSNLINPTGRACGPSMFSPRSKCLFFILQYHITPPPPAPGCLLNLSGTGAFVVTVTLCTCTASKTCFNHHTSKLPPPPLSRDDSREDDPCTGDESSFPILLRLCYSE